MTLLLMIGGILCGAQDKIHRKTDIMADIGAAVIAESLKIHMSHEFSEHWTVEAAAGTCLAKAKPQKTEDEMSHEKGFISGETEVEYVASDMITGQISAVYWPVKTYRGPFLHAGCSVGDDSGVDMAVGAGYCIRIWKGITVRLFSRIDVMNSYKKGKAAGEPLSLGIGYVF